MASILPQICPTASLNQTMRRHLLVKHQNFAQWAVYLTRRGRRAVEGSHYGFEGQHYLDSCLEEGRGVILLVYHFGLAKMLVPALKSLGYDVCIHRYVAATYAGKTFDWMARSAQQMSRQAEEKSGLKIFFHRPDCSFAVLLRHLRRKGILSLNGDGMTGIDFIDAPFLDTVMSFPAGPAQTAAHAQAPIVPIFCIADGSSPPRIIAHRPIRLADSSAASVAEATKQCAAILDQYVRNYPWAWWTWRRLQRTSNATGDETLAAQFVSDNVLSTQTVDQQRAADAISAVTMSSQ